MFLMGGGAMLTGLDLLLPQECEVPVHLAEYPRETVVRGAGHMLEHLERYRTSFQLERRPTIGACGDLLDRGVATRRRATWGRRRLEVPCVGAVVPWARAGVGAVATQSWANTDFGPDGLG